MSSSRVVAKLNWIPVKEMGENVTGVQSDASKLADLDRLFATIKQEQGHLDVVFANAGVGEIAPLRAITEEHFDKTFNINVKGLLFTVQKSLPLLPNGASIILNASIVSIKGTPAFSVYSATKAAVRSFARNWILDLKERQIRVNAISPGVIPTPGYDHLGLSDEQLQEFVTSQANTIPLGRVGTPDEIAKANAWAKQGCAVAVADINAEAVPRETWEALFKSQGTADPQPRIRMLDGFNEGWIEFESGESGCIKGEVELETVLKSLVERSN
jgi:NAD(P)-dependent dehydrogenase (short-subunit alcohol dehydrogenase family)